MKGYAVAVGTKRELLDDLTLTFKLFTVINGITPSKAKKVDLASIYPKEIVASMPDVLKKDLVEALQCYSGCLWTATALMCFRALERELRAYLKGYHGVNGKLDSIFKCIEQFKNYSTNEEFLQNLERIRSLRNASMHGDHRFAPDEADDLFKTTLKIVSWTNNYER